MEPERAEVYDVGFLEGDSLPGHSAFMIMIKTSQLLRTIDDETLVGAVMDRELAPRVAELARLSGGAASSEGETTPD
jgi:hypothetical protein